MTELPIGSVVRLRSGPQRMTVAQLQYAVIRGRPGKRRRPAQRIQLAVCVWHTEMGEGAEMTLPSDCLVVIERPTPQPSGELRTLRALPPRVSGPFKEPA